VRKRSSSRLWFAVLAVVVSCVAVLGLTAVHREAGLAFLPIVKRDLHRAQYRLRGWLTWLSPRHWTVGALAYEPPANQDERMSYAKLAFGELPADYHVPSGWRPFRANSTWNQRLGPNPKLDSHDRVKTAWTFSPLFNDGLNTNQVQVTIPFDAGKHSGTPLYFARHSDPRVYLQCNAGYGLHNSNDCPLPKRIFVPAQAATANDFHHQIIIVQPDGREVDIRRWGTGNTDYAVHPAGQQVPPWKDGQIVEVGWGGVADVLDGSGSDDGATNGAAVVSGADFLAGFVSASDIRARRIDHALAIDLFCNPVANVYPAPIGGNSNSNCNGAATTGDAPVGVGARFSLDTPDASIDSYHIPIGEKALLHARHDFGAFHIVLAGAVVSPPQTPIGVPTATPIGVPTAPPGTTYSSRFTGNTPFHETVATLISKGATQLSSTIASNFWAQGQNGACSGTHCDAGWPMWVANPGIGYTFHCTAYGTCGEHGKTVNYPSGAAAQCVGGGSCNYDYHTVTQDLVHNIEVDGWECQSGPGQCAWGAGYPFTGSGLSYNLASSYDQANAAGYAFGLYVISYADIASGAINHAIGGNFSCDSGGPHVYPASGIAHFTCNGGSGQSQPTVAYGDMVAISAGVDITTLTSNSYCRQVLTAMQKYGFYPMDTNGGYGIGAAAEPSFDLPTDQQSKWLSIEPQLGCLQSVPSGDIKVYQLAVGS
jgi:hypothetical protein